MSAVVFARSTDSALGRNPSLLPVGNPGGWTSLGGGLTSEPRQLRAAARSAVCLRARHCLPALDGERHMAVRRPFLVSMQDIVRPARRPRTVLGRLVAWRCLPGFHGSD